MQFTFCPLFSGSSGNSLFVGAEDTRILIDAGLSGRTVCQALGSIGILPDTLDAILVTHEHSDHIKGIGILSRRYHLPVYANERTWNIMDGQLGAIPAGCRRIFDTGTSFYIKSLEVQPFAIPHDAVDPVGYRVFYGGHSIATATDVGHMAGSVLANLSGADLILLESNHDPEMLRNNEHYSAQLKKRILGKHGHLSNSDCAEALVKLYRTGVRHAILGHLSKENNTPELALRTVCDGVAGAGISLNEEMYIDMAWRDHVGEVYVIA
jgi:phosphoribosyl 1,2-cyclic phosphodiesterase